MIKISKQEVKYLKIKGYLKLVRGKYPNLFISNKKKKSNRKNYYIPEIDILMNALKRVTNIV